MKIKFSFKSFCIKNIFILLLIIFTISGIALILFITSKHNIGISPDSVTYIAGAKNIIQNKSLVVLFDDTGKNQLNLWFQKQEGELYKIFPFPPLYPFILTIPKLLNIDFITGARYINAILFGLNILIITFFIKKNINSNLFSFFMFLLLLFSRDLIYVHSLAWSEPLLFFFGFSGIYFLVEYFKTPKLKFIIYSGILVSLGLLTRYEGVTFIFTGILGILLFSNIKILKRIFSIIIFSLIGVLPVFLWILRESSFNNKIVFELRFNLPTLQNFKEIPLTVSSWFFSGRMPDNFRVILLILFFIFLITLFFMIFYKIRNNEKYSKEFFILKIIILFACFNVINFLVLLISKIFLRYEVILGNDRLISPILISTLVIIILLLSLSFKVFKQNFLKYSFLSFICILIAINISTCIYGTKIRGIYYEGQGYTNIYWNNSNTIKEVKNLPEDALIYTNEPNSLYILANRNPKIFPAKIKFIYLTEKNANLKNELDDMIKTIKIKDGFIVFLDSGFGFFPNEKELNSSYKLTLYKDTADGAIYKVAK